MRKRHAANLQPARTRPSSADPKAVKVAIGAHEGDDSGGVGAGGTRRDGRRVAVLVPHDSQFGRGLLKGVCAYSADTGGWALLMGLPTPEALSAVRALRPDGIIALAPSLALARHLARFGVPAVNCSGNAPGVELPTVRIDNRAVGRLAAEYFLSKGFRHFGYCGRPHRLPLLDRQRGFREHLADAGCSIAEYVRWPALATTDVEEQSARGHAEALARWLRHLPKPAAVFCSDDLLAVHVIQQSVAAGIDVPDAVAVLGVDNDDVLCQAVSPQLSSVALPQLEIGYAAAGALDRLMHRQAIKQPVRLLPPTEVVTRASTDSVAVRDPVVRGALRFIRDHAGEPISVDRVAEEVAVSRRVLEMHFRHALGRTVHREIQKARGQRGARLLRETDWSIARIARAAGFGGRERFSVVFRQLTGETPAQHRRRFMRHG